MYWFIHYACSHVLYHTCQRCLATLCATLVGTLKHRVVLVIPLCRLLLQVSHLMFETLNNGSWPAKCIRTCPDCRFAVWCGYWCISVTTLL
uniref:Uncharacterized protein n=1 Tax=Setaria italica TaxID=4555 RepID=K3ZKJ6_SETIT